MPQILKQNRMDKKTLFEAFPPVSTEEWKDKIIKDLKGADYDRKLVWRTSEGFSVQPFYRTEDTTDLPHMSILPGIFPFVRGNKTKQNDWLIRQDIKVKDIALANAKALDIRLKGVDSLGFCFDCETKPDEKDIEKLLENIRLDLMELNFKASNPLEIAKSIDSLAKKYNRDLNKVAGGIQYDPIGDFSLCGKFNESEEEAMNLLKDFHNATKHLPKFKYITVNGTVFSNAGSGIVSELAFTLAMAADYLTFLTSNGLEIDEVAPKIKFHFAVGSDYFMEIAKFRAARYLWAKIVNAYGLDNDENAKMNIHCSNTQWNKTVYDPYVNMLRTTTESMSAIIGGVDSMSVLPFNAVYEETTDFSERIARNQQLVLKGESYFDKVADVGAGSYYIENLTDMLIHEAWEKFLAIDEAGGYTEAFKKGIIQETVKQEANKKSMDVATRKKSLLGTNQYPNTGEKIEKTIDFSNDKIESEVEPLCIYRGAEEIEKLRLKTDSYSESNKRPVAWMFTYGNLAMRKARSQFAGNFFGCAGFEIVDNLGFKTVEEGIEAAKNVKPEIVILCSSDDEYADIAETAFEALKNDTIVVLAGYPKELVEKLSNIGFTNFIHVRSNLLEELNRYQSMIIK